MTRARAAPSMTPTTVRYVYQWAMTYRSPLLPKARELYRPVSAVKPSAGDQVRHRGLDRPVAHQERRVLPGRLHLLRGPAPVLRQPVPDRRGGHDLLRPPGPEDGRAVGRPDACRVQVRRQGL